MLPSYWLTQQSKMEWPPRMRLRAPSLGYRTQTSWKSLRYRTHIEEDRCLLGLEGLVGNSRMKLRGYKYAFMIHPTSVSRACEVLGKVLGARETPGNKKRKSPLMKCYFQWEEADNKQNE